MPEDSGKNSSNLNGFSGYGLELKGNFVKKWTAGERSCLELKQSMYLQLVAENELTMLPMLAIPITEYVYTYDKLEFKMPFVGPSLMQDQENAERALRTILESISNRMETETQGFKKILKKSVIKYPKSELQEFILNKINECPTDFYPRGVPHGDLGWANMYYKNGQVLCADFHPAIIDSPLLDLASMFMSCAYDNRDHLQQLTIRGINNFKQFRTQINLLIKVLAFIHYSVSHKSYKKRLEKICREW